jgi:hypothetical protein
VLDQASTGASSGSTGTPTADRACFPASPNTAPSSSEAPFATPGWPVNSGVEDTKATTLTIRLTLDRSPTSARTAAIAFRAHCRAHSVACSALTAPPTFPLASSSPPREGSCPEVYTWLPDRTAGTYAATGAATSGTSRPSDASRSSGVDPDTSALTTAAA